MAILSVLRASLTPYQLSYALKLPQVGSRCLWWRLNHFQNSNLENIAVKPSLTALFWSILTPKSAFLSLSSYHDPKSTSMCLKSWQNVLQGICKLLCGDEIFVNLSIPVLRGHFRHFSNLVKNWNLTIVRALEARGFIEWSWNFACVFLRCLAFASVLSELDENQRGSREKENQLFFWSKFFSSLEKKNYFSALASTNHARCVSLTLHNLHVSELCEIFQPKRVI